MNEFYVYILECSDGSYYTGHTDDIDARISAHELGLFVNCYTYMRRPIKVLYVSQFPTRDEAFDAERQIKGWTRKKKRALINGDFELLKYLSKNSHAKYKEYSPSTSSG